MKIKRPHPRHFTSKGAATGRRHAGPRPGRLEPRPRLAALRGQPDGQGRAARREVDPTSPGDTVTIPDPTTIRTHKIRTAPDWAIAPVLGVTRQRVSQIRSEVEGANTLTSTPPRAK